MKVSSAYHSWFNKYGVVDAFAYCFFPENWGAVIDLHS